MTWAEKAREIFNVGDVRGRLTVPVAARLAGISKATYSRRKADPGSMTLTELSALVKPMRMTDDDIITLVRRTTR